MRTIVLRTLALLAMVPATLVAVYFSTLGTAWLMAGPNDPISNFTTAPLTILFMLVAGWAGIVTAWKLYYHFLKSSYPPAWWRQAIVGLFLGYSATAMISLLLPTDCLLMLIFVGVPTFVASVLLGFLVSSTLRRT